LAIPADEGVALLGRYSLFFTPSPVREGAGGEGKWLAHDSISPLPTSPRWWEGLNETTCYVDKTAINTST